MAKNQTFSVSLSLLTKNFEKGVKGIQSSLRKLRGQFQSFAAGIGLGLGVNELLDNARKLDKAQTVLKNVSNTTKSYSDNLKFVNSLSKKYNQELTTLMGNYAKFHSIATNSNMTLEQQEHIYESLTRAAAFFNLSADEMNSMMLAVNQMMSKGKVSSEEFTRQLSERLPGTLNIVADAYGVTAGQMLKMIQNGQVMATDLLPKLANGLNKLTTNLDVDTIEGNLVKMKNSFTALVKTTNVGDVFKKLFGGLAKTLEWVSNNFRNLKQDFITLFAAIASNAALKKSQSAWLGYFKSIEANRQALEKQIQRNTEMLEMYQLKGNISFNLTPEGYIEDLQKLDGITNGTFKRLQNAAERVNENIQDLSNTQPIVSGWQKVGHVFDNAISSFNKLIKENWLFLVTIAISKIVQIVKDWWREQSRVKNMVQDTQKEYDKMVNTLGGEDMELASLRDSVNDKETKDDDRLKYLKKINLLLGLEGKNELTLANYQERMNDLIKERLDLLKKERQYQAVKKIVAEKQSEKEQLLVKRGVSEENIEQYQKKKAEAGGKGSGQVAQAYDSLIETERKAIEKIDKEVAKIDEVLSPYSPLLAQLGADSEERQNEIGNLNNNGEGGPEADYKKIQEEHNNKLRALDDQLADNVIKQEDYNKALRDLYFSTLESIYALNGINENTSPFAKAIKDVVLGYLGEDENLKKTNEALEEYDDKVAILTQKFNDGVITQKELDDELYNLLEGVVDTIYSLGNLSDRADELSAELKKQKRNNIIKAIEEQTAPEYKSDTFFNYKKSDSEILSDTHGSIKEYASDLKSFIKNLKEYKDELSGEDLKALNDNIEILETNLEELTKKAETFSQAAKFAELQEDVKNLKKELGEGIWDNITGIATAAERLSNSWKTFKDTMEDTDSSGWEKFLSVFTTIISTLETLVGIYKTLETALAAYKALKMGMAAAEQAGLAVEMEKVALLKAEAKAASEAATAKHLEAAASVPYPANLVAIASTSAALAAAFAAIPQFSTGGVIPGNSQHGDKILARLNSGELVLNKSQQGALWNMLNAKGTSGGTVEFKIKGTELVGVLNNYSKKISK